VNPVLAQDARVALDHLAAEHDRLARQLVLLGKDFGDGLAAFRLDDSGHVDGTRGGGHGVR